MDSVFVYFCETRVHCTPIPKALQASMQHAQITGSCTVTSYIFECEQVCSKLAKPNLNRVLSWQNRDQEIVSLYCLYHFKVFDTVQ